MTFSPGPASFIRGPKSASPSNTRGGSRMRESRTYGSVRGALSNERPYRDRRKCSSHMTDNEAIDGSDGVIYGPPVSSQVNQENDVSGNAAKVDSDASVLRDARGTP